MWESEVGREEKNCVLSAHVSVFLLFFICQAPVDACISHTGIRVCKSGCERSGRGSDFMMWHIAHQCFDRGKQLSSCPSLPAPICRLFTWIFNFCLSAWFPKSHQHAPLSSSPVSQVRLTASRWRGAAMASRSARTTVTRRTARCARTASSSVRAGSASTAPCAATGSPTARTARTRRAAKVCRVLQEGGNVPATGALR